MISILALGAQVSKAQDCEYLIQVDSVKLSSYRLQLQARDASIDGMCVVKVVDGSIKGMIVNDFGIKALAFTISLDRQKVKLHDVMPMLDHWYIKRVIKNDLKQLFRATTCDYATLGKKTEIEVQEDGSIKMTNSKYHIEYLFIKAPDVEQDDSRQDQEPEIEPFIDDEAAE